jgi:glutamate-ammonia-ligase adenylyltransferase
MVPASALCIRGDASIIEKMSFDNATTPSDEQLAGLGVTDTGLARKNFDLLRSFLGAQPGLQQLVLSQLSAAADPDMALNNLERFVSGLVDAASFASLCFSRPPVLASLVTIFGASRFLSTFLLSDAEHTLSLLSDTSFPASSPGKAALAAELASHLHKVEDEKGLFHELRLFRRHQMLRIALRDLLNKADLRETVEDLSDLAEVCLQAAYERADAALTARYGRPITEHPDGTRVRARFGVIAMGKLGGRELNFSSDVDLMYVYSADGETEGARQEGGPTNRITNHQYFVKLAEKLNAAIGEKTGDGFVFRVDLRLRPEGQRGPLAQSLGGYELYYESWGQTWERSALIKARPAAGDVALGREFLERIGPFVYRKYLDYGALAEIGEMKQKINKDVEQKGRTHRDVKLGYGGIREIEFVIQALQLVYGGRDRALRERNALKALHVLSQKGLITYEEQNILSRAYVFLRTVEHRIQVLDDLQTQTIPQEEREVRALARRTGYLEAGREAASLLRDYHEHTRAVRAIYDDLFTFTGEPGGTEQASAPDFMLLLDPETMEQDAVRMLEHHGFRDAGKAFRNILLMREGSAFIHQTPRSRKLFNDLFPGLFREIIASPDPDMALNHLESFLAAQGNWETLQALLRLDPAASRIIIAIVANREYLSRMLVGRPVLLQNLLESRKAFGAGTYRVFARELSDALSRASGITEKLDALRRFKHQEEIRIGMADLLSGLDMTAVSRDLSKLAEVCLEAAVSLAISEVGKRFDAQFSSPGIAVIAVGKLGSRELTYGSDLDILFVYSESRAEAPPALSAFEFLSRIAEKTISYLSTLTREGFAFRVDTRLRPGGSKGTLVQSIDGFRSYYAASAGTWERQAMLRARCVAGDRAVGRAFCSVLQELIFRDEDVRVLAQDIRSMRSRMEEEAGKGAASSYNIKQGAGGLVDIEFIVQYLQLLYGKKHPSVRVPGAYNGLRALRRERLVGREAFDSLLQAYRLLRRIESRMRIVSDQATNELVRDAGKLQSLARRMGYGGQGEAAGAKLLLDYEAVADRMRKLFESIVRSPEQ